MNCKRNLMLTIGVLIISMYGYAQDTLRITLPQAEKQFLEHNLYLLAEKYNISKAQAEVVQMKLFPNPNLKLEGSVYNPNNNRFADIGNTSGQYAIAAEQLILLAGKRNKQVKLARTASSMAEDRFFDLLRTLSFTLRSNFYKAHYQQNTLAALQQQISTLETLQTTYHGLQAKGIVSGKDAVRVTSLLYNLRAEHTSLLNECHDMQSELQLLLHRQNTWYVTEVTAEPVSLRRTDLQTLLDTALLTRQDLRLAQHALQYSEQNYRLQKAMAVPDLTVGAMFDKRSNYIDNASLLNVAMDLPFFHRNQGNIKAARVDIAQQKLLLEQQAAVVENEVRTVYAQALNTEKAVFAIDPGFRLQLEILLQNMGEHLLKKEVSLLEFTDFYDSYKENILRLNNMQNDRMQAIEKLNYVIGKNLLNNEAN
ncbi:TolC family protein [Chitinophaga niabensis]|uniref:Outer membrane protein, cobalt-zinc-cadmium efflux system n=1 Tax=Chitinophaga niabensis TaxID=536979 RepID=A0A1N6DM68_9BACT|nr:TolC family protein [Chitinophaga niabensis]SIN71919.1 outer membrane protein, cobalt-zinc-cadmium efflux system [Chitinophaga niabensis]